MNDLMRDFFTFYLAGNLKTATERVVQDPDFSYINLPVNNKSDQQLIHYTEEAVFGRLEALFPQTTLLYRSIESEKLSKTPLIAAGLDALCLEWTFLQCLFYKEQSRLHLNTLPLPFYKMLLHERESILLNASEISEIVAQTPEVYRSLVTFQLNMTKNWHILKQKKPDFIKSLSLNYSNAHPWYPVQYTLPLPSCEKTGEIPVIFFEPIKEDLSPFLNHLKGVAAIYVFTTSAQFFHLLSHPVVLDSLLDEQHLIYILELYPLQQFCSQKFGLFKNKPLKPVFFFASQALKTYETVFLEALHDVLNHSLETVSGDTPVGNRLYAISKRMFFFNRVNRLGEARIPALYDYKTAEDWFDSHKGLPPRGKELGPAPDEALQPILAVLAKTCTKRVYTQKKKIRLAHVVPQLVDGGHAPTRVVSNLVEHRNKRLFDVLVICTEFSQPHSMEYPYKEFVSETSEVRGKETIEKMQQSGVTVIRKGEASPYLEEGKDLADLLDKEAVDVVAFHGPNLVNLIATQMTTAPLRILFDHGSQSPFAGFDLALVSTPDGEILYQEHYAKKNTRVKALSFAVNSHEQWEEKPYLKSDLGLPDDALALTTISTKLDARLTDEMLHTIAKILKKVPQAWYAPIGVLYDAERIKRIFAQYGVSGKLCVLGPRIDPSQVARSLSLYLNEFPFGSCLGMLDAMATGCPVVSMYDANGPQQARYGGYFMGMDKVITSGNADDYMKLACDLLTNPEHYQEWSRCAKEQYKRFSNMSEWTSAFEAIICSELQLISFKYP